MIRLICPDCGSEIWASHPHQTVRCLKDGRWFIKVGERVATPEEEGWARVWKALGELSIAAHEAQRMAEEANRSARDQVE